MGTRSFIGIELGDKRIKAVYCHWDGYVQKPGVGYTLLKFYKDQEKVERLISLGSIEALRQHIGEKHDHRKDFDDVRKCGWTTFFGRDLNDYDDESIFTYEEYLEELEHGIEYLYVYRPKTGKWYYSKGSKTFRLVKEKK